VFSNTSKKKRVNMPGTGEQVLRRVPHVPNDAAELSSLMRDFAALPFADATWSAFLGLWQRRIMPSLLSADVDVTQAHMLAARQRTLYAEALALLVDAAPLLQSIAVIFALYALHETQLCEPPVPIPVSIAHTRALLRVRQRLGQPADDAAEQNVLCQVWQADSYLARRHCYCFVAPGTWAPRPSADEAARLLGEVARDAGGDAVYMLSDLMRVVPRDSATKSLLDLDALTQVSDEYMRARQAFKDAIAGEHFALQLPEEVTTDLPNALTRLSETAQLHRTEQIELDQEVRPVTASTTRKKHKRRSTSLSMSSLPAFASAAASPTAVRKSTRPHKAKRTADFLAFDLTTMRLEVPQPPVSRLPQPQLAVDERGNRIFAFDPSDFCAICKVADDGEHFFIGCDKCEAWYHGDCLQPRMTLADTEGRDEWFCDTCRAAAAVSADRPT